MSAVLTPAPPVTFSPPPANLARRFRTADEWLRALGNVPLHRVLLDPPPGTATVDDMVWKVEHEDCGVELVNGTLVEKPVGLRESVIAATLIRLLGNYAQPARRGLVSGEHGMIRMLMGNVRMPDVAYFRRADLPGGQLPADAAPRIAPALAVEVLSPSNTAEEIRLKLLEYFENGVRAAWVLDPPTETLRAYDAAERFRQLTRDDTLDGGDVLPGFSVRVGELFAV